MSSIYTSEPPTSGRVVFETTAGPVEVQLWCHECPQATRVFLQLCQDGFYDNVIFHRIIPDLLIQTGQTRINANNKAIVPAMPKDSTYTESVLKISQCITRQQYETNSRLQFSHRGQVAMARAVNTNNIDIIDDSLNYQFFITLDQALHLNNEHVIFGTVTGPTFFNILKIAQNANIDETTNEPSDWTDAPMIVQVKTIECDLVTIQQTATVPWKVQDKVVKRKKRKGKFNVNVLSFGDDLDESELVAVSNSTSDKRIKDQEINESDNKDNVTDKSVVVVDKGNSAEPAVEPLPKTIHKNPDEPVPAEPVVKQNSTLQQEAIKSQQESTPVKYDSDKKPVVKLESTTHQEASKSQQQLAADSASTDKNSIVEARRAKYLKLRKSNKRERQDNTLSKLHDFQYKIKKQSAATVDSSSDLASRMAERLEKVNSVEKNNTAPVYSGQVFEDNVVQGTSSWMATSFKCKKDAGKVSDDLVVVDERKRKKR